MKTFLYVYNVHACPEVDVKFLCGQDTDSPSLNLSEKTEDIHDFLTLCSCFSFL